MAKNFLKNLGFMFAMFFLSVFLFGIFGFDVNYILDAPFEFKFVTIMTFIFVAFTVTLDQREEI